MGKSPFHSELLCCTLYRYAPGPSKLPVNTLASLVCKTVTQELERFKKDGIVPGDSWSDAVSSSRDSSGHVVYLLQKWSTSWGTYTDVERVAYMKDKDRLTVLFQLAQ